MFTITKAKHNKRIALAELHLSQINGCTYCYSYHAKELLNFGIEQDIKSRKNCYSILQKGSL
ncbi:carboxymuconolactone decarboxylase family protein [Chryseobacterium tructae]|uniref:Carboxymuconolactone decarboxylase family protein n=1 Tax=Chryseobacterium tructae TaxID=1037380 RepID=A0ABV7XU16_9FLAO